MLLLEPRLQFDKCIIGVMYTDSRVVYDASLVIQVFMEINEWSYDEALEWFEYNVLRSLPYYETSPIFVNLDFDICDIDSFESMEEEEEEEEAEEEEED